MYFRTILRKKIFLAFFYYFEEKMFKNYFSVKWCENTYSDSVFDAEQE